MPRVTVRLFIDDKEVDRIDAELASEADAREFVAETKREAAACAEAFADQSGDEVNSFAELFQRRYGEARKDRGQG